MVVEAGGASGLGQPAQAGEGGLGHNLLVEPLPHLVESHEPGKSSICWTSGRFRGEELVEVVVGIDEAGIDRHPGGIDDAVGLPELRGPMYRFRCPG